MATLKLRKKNTKSKSKTPSKKTSRSKAKDSGEPKRTVALVATELLDAHRTAKPTVIAGMIRKEFPKAAKKWNDTDWILGFASRYNRGTLRIQKSGAVTKPAKQVALVGMKKKAS